MRPLNTPFAQTGINPPFFLSQVLFLRAASTLDTCNHAFVVQWPICVLLSLCFYMILRKVP
ncbi:hypothetical protein COO20_03130, partial [Thalassospira marina]